MERSVIFNAKHQLSEELPIFGESGTEGSYLIPEPRKFVEVTRLSEDIRKSWLKENLKQIKNLINNQTFLVDNPEKGEPVTPCMDVYKKKINMMGVFTN